MIQWAEINYTLDKLSPPEELNKRYLIMDYKICNLYVDSKGGSIGDYIFKRVEDYDERIKHLYKSATITQSFRINFINNTKDTDKQMDAQPKEIYEPMRYGGHQVTAIAAIPDDKENPSVFSVGKKAIYDALLLYNFLTGRNSCLEEDMEEFSHLDKNGVHLGEECKYTTAFLISTILDELQKIEWHNGSKNKEVLSFLFLLDSKNPKALQISFLEKFSSCEILEPTEQFYGAIFEVYKIADFIPNFTKGNFKEIISVIRNHYSHGGQCLVDGFKTEILKRGITTGCRNFINAINAADFDQFKIDTWMVLDYIICIIFCEIFNTVDKVGNFNKYWCEQSISYFKRF